MLKEYLPVISYVAFLLNKHRKLIPVSMRKTFILIIALLSALKLDAQSGKNKNDNNFLQVGIKAGAGFTKITDLSKVLVSESYYTGYTFENSGLWGFTGGIYINYKLGESISAIYSEISYAQVGNKLHYSDIDGLIYDFILKYNYLNLELWYKVYLLQGLSVGLGPRIGFNLTPGDLFYTSNGELLYGPDIRIQQQMRDVLKGRTNFSLGVSLGYEFSNGISIDARFYYGVSDVMETEVNNFHFIENTNASRVLQITLGYAIPYNLHFF